MRRPSTAVHRASLPSSKNSHAIRALLFVLLGSRRMCSVCASRHGFPTAFACLCSKEMTADEFYRRVEARLPETIEVDGRTIVHELLTALADRLKPDEAAQLGTQRPDELGDILAHAHGDGTLTRDDLIEELASRLDLDDDDAETGAIVVLSAVREAIEPSVEIEQVLESLPPDLAQLMQ